MESGRDLDIMSTINIYLQYIGNNNGRTRNYSLADNIEKIKFLMLNLDYVERQDKYITL